MPQLRIHPVRAFEGGFGITGSGGALMYMDGLGVQKNRGPTKLLELSWANVSVGRRGEVTGPQLYTGRPKTSPRYALRHSFALAYEINASIISRKSICDGIHKILTRAAGCSMTASGEGGRATYNGR